MAMTPGRAFQRSALLNSLPCCRTFPLRQYQLLSRLQETPKSLSLFKATTGPLFNRYQNSTNGSLPGLTPCARRQVSNAARREVVQFKLSDIGEGIAEVNIKEWYVTVGQVVNQFDSICEVQSDKASVTITSKFDGVVRKLHHDVDDIAKVGQPLVDIEILAGDGSSDDLVDEIDDLDATDKCPTPGDSYKKSLATPAVRRLAMENKVDLSMIHGGGKDGRVMKEDVLHFLESRQTRNGPPISSPGVATPQPASKSQSTSESVTKSPQIQSYSVPTPLRVQQDSVVKMSPITRAMLKSMTKSLQIPHLGLSEDVDVCRLVQMRGLLKDQGITFLPFFLKAASLALIEFPVLNSSIHDEANGELLLKADHNIGFALDTPSGLLVPNVKRVQDKSILQISQEIKK